MRVCGCGEAEDIKLLRHLSIGNIFMDSEISKSYDGNVVGENNSEPSPNNKEGRIVTAESGSCLQKGEVIID